MPPFIKFTGQSEAAKPSTHYVYVNVSHIVQATYYPEAKNLQVLVEGPTPGSAQTRHLLQGAEAGRHRQEKFQQPLPFQPP